MKPIHYLLVDDHVLFRKGLSLLLHERPGCGEVSEAESLEEALALSMTAPDVILLDVKLPGVRGIDGIGLLKGRWPAALIFIVSALESDDAITEATASGADGYISKSAHPESLVEEIEEAIGRGGAMPASATAPDTRLTARQLEILALICEGHSNKLIAKDLSLAENTVRRHVQDILEFFHVDSRTEAIAAARRRGYAE